MPYKEKLLVLDASVTVQKLVHLTFADSDFEVVTAIDGPDALQKLKLLKPAIFFIETDGLNSIGTAARNLSRDEKLDLRLVLFCSGNDKPPENITIHGILRKPFQSRELRELTQSLLRKQEDLSDRSRENSEATGTTVIEGSLVLNIAEELVAPESELSTVVTAVEAAPAVATEASSKATLAESFEVMARVEIEKWIDSQLPALAQKILREEIEKRLTK